jgi:cell division septum initiation protein DivIVA
MTDENSTDPSSARAINRVLQAEREAAEAVAACEREARDILQAAQQLAGHIAGRTDERISRLQLRSAQRVTARIGELEREADRARREMEVELDESGLRECIEAVAACLTGGVTTAGVDSGHD